jgi:CubicO group peptidase (beta-lactamase class C family)
MKKICLFTIALAIGLTACSDKSKVEKMEKLFKDYQGKVPGASVMVIKNGKIDYEEGFGYANLEKEEKVRPATNFRLASVTKQFTAASILILQQQGKLSLDQTLTDLYPDFPEYGGKITIENILNHTSGLIDYESLLDEKRTDQIRDAEILEMMKQQDSTYFNPGSKHQYSNTGYAVLAMIIEKLSGKSFAEFLDDNIFTPLRMENTVAFEKGISTVRNRAYGYTIDSTGIHRTDQNVTSAVLGDGGIYSSTRDLFKWDQSLYTNKILSEENLEASFTRQKTSDGEEFDYGYGWRLENYSGMEVTYHTGSSIGFRTILYRIPAEKFSVIILTNRDEGDTLELAHKVVDLYLEEN